MVQICQRRPASRRSELSWHTSGQKFGSYAVPEWRFEFDDAPVQLERIAASEWPWGFGLEEALTELQKARDWLFSNEEGVDPSLDAEESPAILQAWSKMSTRLQGELSDSPSADTS